MPTVLVTGIAGRIGRGVASSLRTLGHRIVGVDVTGDASLVGPVCDAFVQCDLVAAAEPGPAADALRLAATGVSCVVHCAAWPGPSATPPPAVEATGSAMKRPAIGYESATPSVLLRDNVASTAATCDAAIAAGASRFVFSSSAFAMGYSHAAIGPHAWCPRYLPVDELHGAMPMETYGLSKLLGEEVLESAARTATSTSFVSLRFTNIVKRERWSSLPWPAPSAAEPLPLILWAYTHEDDVIEAHVAAVTRPEAARPGSHEAYLLAAPDTRFAEPTLDLLKTALGVSGLPLRSPMAGNASVLCADKARERLGVAFRSWRPPASEEVPAAAPSTAASALRGSPAALHACAHHGAQSPQLRGSPAARRALADPRVRHFDLSGFELGCGRLLPVGASLAFKVHGPPIGQGAGIVLHPTSFDAVHNELEYQIGPGQTLDTARYTVIVPNLLGNGVSYSPSLIDPAAGLPPLFSVRDNVRAQRELLEHLGVGCSKEAPLDLVYGYSMGALQAYEWAVAWPESVRRIAAVCGAARCGELNRVFLGSIEAALKADAAWDAAAGRFTRPPTRGLAAFGSIYAGWGVGSSWYTEAEYARAGFASAEDFVERSYLPAFANCDADDLLSQIRTWRDADVAVHTGGDLRAALGRVRARVLLMPCDQDRYFTLGEAEREAALLGDRCVFRPIVSAAGHRAGDPHRPELGAEATWIRRHVYELLAE